MNGYMWDVLIYYKSRGSASWEQLVESHLLCVHTEFGSISIFRIVSQPDHLLREKSAVTDNDSKYVLTAHISNQDLKYWIAELGQSGKKVLLSENSDPVFFMVFSTVSEACDCIATFKAIGIQTFCPSTGVSIPNILPPLKRNLPSIKKGQNSLRESNERSVSLSESIRDFDEQTLKKYVEKWTNDDEFNVLVSAIKDVLKEGKK